MKCDYCGERYHATCDYRQGRCPHHPPLIKFDFLKKYKEKILNFFKRK